jgi:hypothetical protein
MSVLTTTTADAERAERIAAAETRLAAASARTAAAAEAIAALQAMTDAATTDRRRRRRNRVAGGTDAADIAERSADAARSAATDDVVMARFDILARPENATMIRSVATHAARQRHAGNHDADDIAQRIRIALATASVGSPSATAMTLCALVDGDPNRRLARKMTSNMARRYASHDAAAAKRERASGVLTMGELPTAAHHDAVAAALASDGAAQWTDRDDSYRINAATQFAAAMGTATATARDADAAERMANAEYVRRNREQTIGGRQWDSQGIVRLVREKSLENMLTQPISCGGALVGGVHGGGGADAADSLAMRRFQETFYTAPTPTFDNATSWQLANACDRLRSRKVRAVANLCLLVGGVGMSSVERSALQAIASGQVKSWGTLVAACVVSYKPRQRGRKSGNAVHVAAVHASQVATADADAADAAAAMGQPIAADVAERTTLVRWSLFLKLLGFRGNDAAARKVAVSMTQTLARDAGAPYDAARGVHGAMTAERIASPNTRGGMTPLKRHDALRSHRGMPYRLRADAAPQTLRVAKHAAIGGKARAWRETDATDTADTAPRKFRGDPPMRVNAAGAADPFGHVVRPMWADPTD